MKGYGWVACSVLLVSAAQLMMRWAMPRLPEFCSLLSLPAVAIQPALLLLAGLEAYGVSMLCWIRALHFFSLNRVYPLLSLSYAGVVGGRQPAGVSGGSQLAQSGRCGDDYCWSALHRG